MKDAELRRAALLQGTPPSKPTKRCHVKTTPQSVASISTATPEAKRLCDTSAEKGNSAASSPPSEMKDVAEKEPVACL